MKSNVNKLDYARVAHLDLSLCGNHKIRDSSFVTFHEKCFLRVQQPSFAGIDYSYPLSILLCAFFLLGKNYNYYYYYYYTVIQYTFYTPPTTVYTGEMTNAVAASLSRCTDVTTATVTDVCLKNFNNVFFLSNKTAVVCL